MKTNHGPSGYGRLNGKTRVNCINHPLIEIRFKRREWNSEKHHEKHPPDKTRNSVFIRRPVQTRCFHIGCD